MKIARLTVINYCPPFRQPSLFFELVLRVTFPPFLFPYSWDSPVTSGFPNRKHAWPRPVVSRGVLCLEDCRVAQLLKSARCRSTCRVAVSVASRVGRKVTGIANGLPAVTSPDAAEQVKQSLPLPSMLTEKGMGLAPFAHMCNVLPHSYTPKLRAMCQCTMVLSLLEGCRWVSIYTWQCCRSESYEEF